MPAPAVRLSQSLPLPLSAQPKTRGKEKDDDEAAADALVVGGQEGEEEDDLCSEKEIGEIDRRLAALQAFLAQAQRGTALGGGGGGLSQSA